MEYRCIRDELLDRKTVGNLKKIWNSLDTEVRAESR